MMLQLRALMDASGRTYDEPLPFYVEHTEVMSIQPIRVAVNDATVYSAVTVVGPTRSGIPTREQYGPFCESPTDVFRMKMLAEGVLIPGWRLDGEGRLAPAADEFDLATGTPKERAL